MVIAQERQRKSMAAETIPTIDLSPLRSGSDAGKREVARQIDDACTRHRLLHGDRHGVPADLITKTRQRAIDFFALPGRREDEGAAAAGQDQPRLQLGRRSFAIAYSMGQAAPPDIQEAFAFGQTRRAISRPRSIR